ncbi:MAG: hypothetical protein QOF98_708, partial [Streptomyces sp.]|nr:hypothetical protein [Streptomyces sp.]
NATIWNRDRTVVPNDFIVELSAPDYERLSPYAVQLGDELAGMVKDYAKQQRYTFMGPIKVHLERADDLDTGLYRVRSRTLASSESQHAQPQSAPPSPGPSARQSAPAGYQQPPSPQSYQPGRPASAPPMPAAPPPGAPRPAVSPGAPISPAGPVGPAPVTRLPGTGYPAGSPAAATRRWIEINGTRHQIARSTLVLGRSTEADVRVDDPGVSRKHCEIRVGTPPVVQDLGSTNGIVVDGQHTTRATLRDGSRIVVGSTTIVYRQAEG